MTSKKEKIEIRMKEAQESLRKLLEAAADSSGEENTESGGIDADFRNEMPDMSKAEVKMKEKIESQSRLL